jgi:cytochrome c-type protein NapB
MTSRQSPVTGVLLGLFLIGSAVTAGAAVIVGLKDVRARRDAEPRPLAVTMPVPPAVLIAAEADVFRTTPGMTAIDPEADPQRAAIQRTTHRYRVLRAYPGAPPSIPHGFTGDEFRTGACRTCHERGGYSPRFNAYVPLTPHPEMGTCLQCHVGNDAVTGVSLPDTDPNTICRQCHPPNAALRVESTIDWQPMAWPQLQQKTPDGPPPPILHDLQFRGNCLACHSGPGALATIRTPHPERANCRQCHVTPDARVGLFTRPVPDSGDGTGEAS